MVLTVQNHLIIMHLIIEYTRRAAIVSAILALPSHDKSLIGEIFVFLGYAVGRKIPFYLESPPVNVKV
jgi:hypothetical protein